MVIFYGTSITPFGMCTLGTSEGKIVFVSFSVAGKTNLEMKIKKVWTEAELVRDDTKIELILEDIFKNKKKFSKFNFKGTDFQIKVWTELLKIPHGKTSTYKEIAKKIGSPRAARAVGTACGKNHIPYLVPCHRVLASNGKIGGYNGGIKRKIAMLNFESSAIIHT